MPLQRDGRGRRRHDGINHPGLQAGAVLAHHDALTATGQGPSLYLEDPESNRIELKGRG